MAKYLVLSFLFALPIVSAREPVAHLGRLPVDETFTVTNGQIEKKGEILVWTIPRGQTSTLALSQGSPLINRLRYFDRLAFDYRIVSGRIQFLFDVDAHGLRPGPRQAKQHEWHIGFPTTEPNVWHQTQVVFDIPAWLKWDPKDGLEHETELLLEVGAGAEDLVIELRDLKLVPDLIYLKPWWLSPVSFPIRTEDRYRIEYQLVNLGKGKQKVRAEIQSQHDAFDLSVEPAEVEVLPFGAQMFTVTAKLVKTDLPELYEEDLHVAFVPQDEPEGPYLASGWLVKPLAEGYQRQVVYSQDDLERLKGMLDREEVRKWLQLERRTKNADWFLDVKLAAIPGTRGWAHSGYRGDSCPTEGCEGRMKCGDVMPFVVCPKCGRQEAATQKAATVWKLWLGSNTSGEGGLDDLGTVYLLTGDEKYARKAIDLFLLYAEQYEKLPWTGMANDARYYRGNYLLAASRIAHASTYGSNFLLKGHFRLLNMIANSPSWTDEERKKVHEGFVLPAAAELAKFPGGLFNMTDITNYDLILAGLSCGDANILYRGLQWESGLVKRLTDIKPDGFSSEGRPLNYHYASMNEYVTSVPLIKNSGLPVEVPFDLLKAAVRMPYERATLSGYVPVTGDNGTGGSARANRLCDVVYELFPEEEWLYRAGRRSTLRTFLKSVEDGPPEADAWRDALKDTPTLFPHAGFAILRSGKTQEEQVYVTLDYGENPMHAALDRLQITLWAYGRVFTQGPGSSYNAPTNFERGAPEAMAFISHDSLGNNVIMVDRANQSPAIGSLIAWAPDLGSKAGKVQAVAAEVRGHHPGVTHRRAVFLVRNAIVLLDDVGSSQEHTYDFVYHNFGSLVLGEGWQAVSASQPLGDKANYQNIRQLQRLDGDGDLRLKWDLGEGLALEFWQTATGGAAYTGLTGLNHWHTRMVGDDAPSIFVRTHGKSKRFVTVLQPLKNESNVERVVEIKQEESFGAAITFKDGKTVELFFWPKGKGQAALRVK